MIAEDGHRLHVSWYTNTPVADGLEHAVADEEFALARDEHRHPEAACGRIMVPTSLTAEIGSRCPACIRYVAARQTMTGLKDDSSWLARLLHRIQTSWPFRGGTCTVHRHGQDPNHGGLAAPPADGAAVLHII